MRLLGKTRRIHFVGIGGIGMSGMAELLANLGYAVSGSDIRASDTTRRLGANLGVTVYEGHRAANVGDADVVVFSSAVKPDNVECIEANRRGTPVIPRGEMLAELMRLRSSIAVAGSHGKTTTTSMIAVVLERAGLDPTAIIGGRLRAFGSNARLGRGEYMVAEADESDQSFLRLWPSIAVITNVDHEHMENYGSFEHLRQAFTEFANRVPFYGTVVACANDLHLASVLSEVKRSVVTYGLDDADADLIGTDVALGSFGARCVVHRREAGGLRRLGTLELTVPGRHNLLNGLAAAAVADLVGVGFDRVQTALAGFQGVERRFERVGEAGGVLVVDDYAHHPTEIAAVLTAARAWSDRRLVVAFQPHRYSRTSQLMDAFGPSFHHADEIVLTDIYPAGEDPIPGVTVEALADAVRRGSGRPVHLVPSLEQVVPTLKGMTKPGDVVIMLGAGSIGTLPRALIRELGTRGLEC